jgi:outer membrane receptor protein involved in Fe transport
MNKKFISKNIINYSTIFSMLLFNGYSNANTDVIKNEITSPTIERIQVLGDRKSYYTEITENAEKLIQLPGTLGDPIVAIATLPGVIIPNNGSEPAVRGSSPSDNRYYIDGIPAGKVFHSFNTSILDVNTIQDFQLYSAGFGAQYADATGAIFDIRLRDPKQQAIKTTVDASLLRAGIFVEGSVTENSSMFFSMRQGLIQYFIPEDDEEDEDGIKIKSPPEDDDYLFKYVWDINDQNKLSVNLVGAGDYAEAELTERSNFAAENPDFAGDAKLDEHFDSQAITWLHNLKNGSELTIIAANYNRKDNTTWGDNYFEKIKLNEQLLKAQYKFSPIKSHTVTLGLEHKKSVFEYDIRSVLFVCTEFDADCQSTRRDIIEDKRELTNTDKTAYLIDFWQVTDDLDIETGLQYNQGSYLNEHIFNPRIAINWYFTEDVALTSSAGRYNRFPDVNTVLPLLGNPELDSPLANHYTLGLKGELSDNINWHIDTYHKKLTRLPLGLNETEAGSDKLYSNDVKGEANGIDLFINRNLADNWYGWVSLSYSKSKRTNQRNNETRDYRFDTPVVFNIVGNYRFTPNWDVGFRFIAKSGEATTNIIDIKPNPLFPDQYLAVYDEPFDARLPTYMRLDIRFQRQFSMFNNDAKFYIDIINALNKQNITERTLDYKRVNQTGQLHIEEEADFGIFPSVGITFSF